MIAFSGVFEQIVIMHFTIHLSFNETRAHCVENYAVLKSQLFLGITTLA